MVTMIIIREGNKVWCLKRRKGTGYLKSVSRKELKKKFLFKKYASPVRSVWPGKARVTK